MSGIIAPSPAQPPAGPAPVSPARAGSAAAYAEPARGSADPAAPAPSPRLSLDPATGLVVIEFRASAGRPGQSFPTPRELDAYRRSLGASAGALSGPQSNATSRNEQDGAAAAAPAPARD